MDAIASKNHDKDVKKMTRGGGKQQECQSHSFWGAMALKNRRQSGGGREAAAESKNSSSSKKTKRSSISISRSMTCAGSICSTKESAVLSRGSSRRSSTGGSGRNALKAPGNDGAVSVSASVPASGAAVSASSSFNSETTAGTATTTASSSSTLSWSAVSSPLSSIGAGSRSFRKLSGCYYECHTAAALDPRTSLAAAAMLPCADCNEAFMNAGSLELHRSTRHAVSELGADDTSRNVVEIIFQSSWLVGKLPAPAVCRVERVLKVRSSGKTVERFEQYRERVKARAASSGGGGGDELAKKSYPRCAADGNELLRFHCTTFTCSLGLAGATALCRTSSPQCKLCSILRDGFSVDGDGRIATMATSGRAHDTAARVLSPDSGGGEKRAMLVCRVVAGRVKKIISGSVISSEVFDCDSVSSCSEGVYSDLDELFVFNPRAILPCFVVIYSDH